MKVEFHHNEVTITDYINVVGTDSRVLHDSVRGKYIEQIVPKSFYKSLLEVKNVLLLLNHDRKRILGSVSRGNVELFEDELGLLIKCTITDKKVINKVRKHGIRGWSFGFIKINDYWRIGPDGIQRRYIDELYLTEVSLLVKGTTPAYPKLKGGK